MYTIFFPIFAKLMLVVLMVNMAKKIRIISHSEEDTRNVAGMVAPLFHSGDIIILDGDLGAGKTYFVKGFAEGCHSKELVHSPTFSIANFYRTLQSDILHIDLFRISTIDEFYDMGLFDYFSQTIVLIEWGKKFEDLFEDYLLVSFVINNDNTRTLTITNHGDKYAPTMDELKNMLKGNDLC